MDDSILEQDWLRRKQLIIQGHLKKEKGIIDIHDKAKKQADIDEKAKEEALETAHAEKKKAIDREFKLKQYDAEKKQFESDKAFKLTEAWLG